MRAAALALLVCVVACDSAPHRASVSTPAASQPAASSARSAAEPLDAVDFSCSLPVSTLSGDGSRGTGFLALPGRSLRTSGASGSYYDWVVRRWLAVPPGNVAPDGRRYAEIEQGTEGTASVARVPARIRVVDAATDASLRLVAMPDAVDWDIYDFAATGIEAFEVGPGIGAPLAGVWNVDPDTGVVTKVADGYIPPSARWFLDQSHSKVLHRDSAGQTTTWVEMPGYFLHFIPFAGDSAILVVATRARPDGTPGVDLWLVRGPGKAVELLSSLYGPVYGPGGNTPGTPYWYMVAGIADSPGVLSYSGAIVDEHGIWLAYAMSAGNGQGNVGELYLVTPAGAILRVDDRPLFPAGTCA